MYLIWENIRYHQDVRSCFKEDGGLTRQQGCETTVKQKALTTEFGADVILLSLSG